MSQHPKPPATDLFVCTTCRDGDACVGDAFYQNLSSLLEGQNDVAVHPVECLSVCKRPCTVAVSAPGKWTYIIGDLDMCADAPQLLEYLATYIASPHGTPPLKERPAAIRRGTVARIPPQPQGKAYANAS